MKLGVTTTQGTALKGHSIRKIENHCSKSPLKWKATERHRLNTFVHMYVYVYIWRGPLLISRPVGVEKLQHHRNGNIYTELLLAFASHCEYQSILIFPRFYHLIVGGPEDKMITNCFYLSLAVLTCFCFHYHLVFGFLSSTRCPQNISWTLNTLET